MEFGVIYSIDTDSQPKLESAMETAEEFGLRQTEGDDLCQYDFYESWQTEEGYHRKVVGVLDKREMWEFSNATNCFPTHPNERGPVVGAPGAGFCSSAEALYFSGPTSLSRPGRNEVAEIAVTPYPEMEQVEPWALSERETDRLFEAVYNAFA